MCFSGRRRCGHPRTPLELKLHLQVLHLAKTASSDHSAAPIENEIEAREHLRSAGRVPKECDATLWLVRRYRRDRISIMETAKDQVHQILEMLPEDVSLEDIQYHIYVRQKIQQGLDDVAAGRVVSHEEVQRRLEKWLTR